MLNKRRNIPALLLLFSCVELPDAVFRDASQSGKVQRQRSVWLRPQTRLYETRSDYC